MKLELTRQNWQEELNHPDIDKELDKETKDLLREVLGAYLNKASPPISGYTAQKLNRKLNWAIKLDDRILKIELEKGHKIESGGHSISGYVAVRLKLTECTCNNLSEKQCYFHRKNINKEFGSRLRNILCSLGLHSFEDDTEDLWNVRKLEGAWFRNAIQKGLKKCLRPGCDKELKVYRTAKVSGGFGFMMPKVKARKGNWRKLSNRKEAWIDSLPLLRLRTSGYFSGVE